MYVWHSGIVSSEVAESYLEFSASLQSPFLPSFRNMMKVLPLSSLKVMLSLRYYRYYGQLRLPYRPNETSVSLISISCPLPWDICKGLPCYPVWLPLRVDLDTPRGHLSVLAVIVRIDVSAFLYKSKSRHLQFNHYEATCRFAFATTRWFACPT